MQTAESARESYQYFTARTVRTVGAFLVTGSVLFGGGVVDGVVQPTTKSPPACEVLATPLAWVACPEVSIGQVVGRHLAGGNSDYSQP